MCLPNSIFKFNTALAVSVILLSLAAATLSAAENNAEKPAASSAKKATTASKAGTVSGVDIQKKMNSLIIPNVDMSNTTLSEAIDFLRKSSRSLDKSQGENKGINFVIRGDGSKIIIPELKLKNVSILDTLKAITGMTGMRFKIEKYAVVLYPLSTTNDAPSTTMVDRTYVVPPTFYSDLRKAVKDSTDS